MRACEWLGLERFGGAGDHGENQGAGRTRDGVDAAGRPARVVPRRADARIVRHRALEDPDLLVADVAMTRNHRALVIAHEHGLVAPVGILPERLPEDTGSPLHPRDLLGVDEAAHWRCRHEW